MPDFAVGALVRTRGREWVVLPESTSSFLKLRPLGGTDDEVAGVFLLCRWLNLRHSRHLRHVT